MIGRGMPGPVRRGFTLAELVVVVGLIALLTAGIGRLFAGVSNAVGRGLAVSELNATARSIEEGLRRDIARANRTNSDETFLVIRAVELGGDRDRPIYLTLEDKEADLRDGIDPYEPGSRAIVTRLDEMAFLARSGGADSFRSQQDNGIFTNSQPTADAARIYYGHGLRPRNDPDWPIPEPVPDGSNTSPLRQFVSDGWFGSPAGEDMRGYLPNGRISGRNEFASEWILARQALLLYGASATGVENPDNAEAVFGENREYAPYIRDLETLSRFWRASMLPDAPAAPEVFGWPGPVNSIANSTFPRPDQRLIGHGRVDVCAQTLGGVRRWLEGEDPVWDSSLANGDGYRAAPYDDTPGSALGVPTDPELNLDNLPRYGAYGDNELRTGSDAIQRWLWRRSADFQTSPELNGASFSGTLLSAGVDGNPLDDLAYNLIGIRSAIAGVLARPLIEFEPGPATRVAEGDLNSAERRDRYAQETDSEMDSHAVLAPRCSRFEIAWSDGSYWVTDTDLDADGTVDARSGELVWFDITRVDPAQDPAAAGDRRLTYDYLWQQYGDQNDDGVLDTADIQWAVQYTNTEALSLSRSNGPLGGHEGEGVPLTLRPEVGYGDLAYFTTEPTFASVSLTPLDRLLWMKAAGDFAEAPSGSSDVASVAPYYNPDLSGGVPSGFAWPDSNPGTPSADMQEYLAVWPFRVPSSTGEWGEDFEKNVLLRVRFTLHDPLDRIPGGQTYEVVLHLHPRDEHG